ncbi:MAG: TonB-dependent receptor [Caldimonas sp.]
MSCHFSALRAPRAVRALLSLAFAILFASSPTPADAQSTLDPVVVTGTREPETLSRSAADIVVIDSATLRASTADSVEDLLRREAGLQLARNGGPGQTSGFFIRGASTNSTVVLVDGVRIGSATAGQAEFEALSLSQIDRIEVLRGPASSLYGADAVGGVVQIFTRRGEGGPRLTAFAAIGGEGSRQGSAAVSGAAGAFDYAASLGRDSSRGVSALFPGDRFGSYNPDRDGYARNSGSLQLGYAVAPGHRIAVHALETNLRSQFDSAQYGPPDYVPDPSPDFRSRLASRVTSADYRGVVSAVWTTTAQISRSVDDLTSGAATPSRFVTRREQGTWQNALALGAGQQLMVAYEHLSERAAADGFTPDPKRRNDAVVLGYSGSLDRHSLQADLRRDDNSDYGGNTTGRIGYAFTVVPGLKLRALAGTTFRAPTFNDLFYPGYGVATVRPEKGRSIEVGVSWQGSMGSASATVYRNRVRDLIGYQADRAFCPVDPAFNFGCAGNISRARLQGATFAGSHHWGGFAVRASVDLLDAKDADTGERLVRRAAHQETLVADYDAGPWRIGASGLFVGSRPEGGAVLGGYGVLDLRASWRLQRQWQLEAKLLNALDHRIEPVRDYQGIGRQAWLGIRFDSAGL